ncbi:hypothetical protein AK830_g8102 [Neonectria ditissima]|uniref:G-protein coupled receptors family 1 profile domain-containing protein n=1 Tax=Neonectria ditissima TaxID=78410 RepID=A0A0P7AVC3_9HYPO|nr:hypothetical protein AK830_g8102 [Neonectria ditissima]
MAVDVDQAIASVTLAGSLLSCLATTFVLLSFSIYRRQLHSFRHILVLNLTVAEFINTLNNSISGVIFVGTHELRPGAACEANGLIGQLSVQAADFSILAIALVTLLTVTRVMYMPDLSTTSKFMICLAIWVIPVTTSIVPTAMGEMTPVGGNWCWISASRVDLRYALTHGWRFLVIFSTILIYVYIWIYLRQHLSSNRGDHHSSSFGSTICTTNSAYSCFGSRAGFKAVEGEETELDDLEQASPKVASTQPSSSMAARHRSHDIERAGQSGIILNGTTGSDMEAQSDMMDSKDRPAQAIVPPSPAYFSTQHKRNRSQHDPLQTNISEFPMRRDTSRVEREIKRMMLLNEYPLMYVLLWVPGLINRLMEASGNAPSPTVMAALQVSTQFVGFANALTYGFNNHLRDRLKGLYLTPAVLKIRRTFER